MADIAIPRMTMFWVTVTMMMLEIGDNDRTKSMKKDEKGILPLSKADDQLYN
jgi:hypothetical protein